MRGDGIGPEIIDQTLSVLESACRRFRIHLSYDEVPAGDSALREYGDALPIKSVEAFANSDACLKGPVGETVMVINTKLRFGFDLYANVRPAVSYPGICPPALSPDIDITVIRENSEGFYRALENEVIPGVWTTTGVFTEWAAKRIAEFSFRYAESERRHRHKIPKLALATKANIFRKSQGMYVRIFEEVAKSHPGVKFEHYYADALCARLVREPEEFHVIVSENLLADLLSDLAGQVAGGLGMTPGTNINYERKLAYFEPTHGSAPDIVGRGIANPIGQIRSAALMLRYLSLIHKDQRLSEAADSIEASIGILLSSSDRAILPREIGGTSNTNQVGDMIASLVEGGS